MKVVCLQLKGPSATSNVARDTISAALPPSVLTIVNVVAVRSLQLRAGAKYVARDVPITVDATAIGAPTHYRTRVRFRDCDPPRARNVTVAIPPIWATRTRQEGRNDPVRRDFTLCDVEAVELQLSPEEAGNHAGTLTINTSVVALTTCSVITATHGSSQVRKLLKVFTISG